MRGRGTLGAGVLLLAGCSIFLGKPYQQLNSVPYQMAVIYFYDEDATPLQSVVIDTEAHNSATNYQFTMIQGGYYPFLHDAGRLRLITNLDADQPACITLETLSGFHYWVRISKASGEVRPIEVMAPNEGEAQIANHRRIDERRATSDHRYEGPCPENGAEGTR